MSRIRILPENLANQIAAGEVVERPASVVKELVENAIDAGGSQISVQVEGAGTRMLRVIDNGCGMDPDDLLLCLERHATSKLGSADDLIQLTSLGFRGEAIPSIASVARMTITSRPAGLDLGCRVEVRFGAVQRVHEMGCAQGTVIEVADLFANVPARRKFLKSANTELAHIDEVVRSYALVSFQTGFAYQVNGRELINLPAGEESAGRRVRQVLGDGADLIPIASDEASARAEIQVSGYLLPPDRASGRAGRLWTFVNGRYIKDRMVNHAVAEGMQGFLMKGGRPAGVVYLRLPPAGVDVNVHPTKQEVRFQENNLVHNKIVAAVWRGMEAYQAHLKDQLFGVPRQGATQTAAPLVAALDTWPPAGNGAALEVREPAPPAAAPRLPFASVRGLPADPDPPPAAPPAMIEARATPPDSTPPPQPHPVAREGRRQDAVPSAPTVDSPREGPTHPPLPDHPEPSPRPADPSRDLPPAPAPIRYLGQLFETYLLCQLEDGLLAIDQHAVQERLIFEELKRQYTAGSMPSQLLMFPEMVELRPAEVEALDQHGPEFLRLGLELQEFGGDTVLIKAVPAGLSHLPASEILRGILHRFIDEGLPGRRTSTLDDVLAGMACKAAIKAGQGLEALEAQHLLERMQAAGIFSHCPHGRPVFKRFSRLDIEKWFQRA